MSAKYIGGIVNASTNLAREGDVSLLDIQGGDKGQAVDLHSHS